MNKLNILLKSNEKLFHTQDLALLWMVENRNTLLTTIKRYVKKGILIQIVKGFYSTVPINEIDKFELGTSLIHRYCYVSCETVLFLEGVINQVVYPITYVSSISTKIEINGILYIYRQAKPELLLNSDGILQKKGYFMATKERAISDMMYFNPKYYLDTLEK
jgi:predicted transcriptional regulator of viral defense system